jgi:hypothetical protein
MKAKERSKGWNAKERRSERRRKISFFSPFLWSFLFFIVVRTPQHRNGDLHSSVRPLIPIEREKEKNE